MLPVLRPMLAVPGEIPAQDDLWAYEMKWDGVRAIVRIEDGAVQLTSRNDLPMTVAYPELTFAPQNSHGTPRSGQFGGQSLVLDGEIVCLGADGRPDFARLQRRMHVQDPAAAQALSRSDPAVLLIFDLLHLNDTSLLDRPYVERRERLEALALEGEAWAVPPAFHGDGTAAITASQVQRLEGVVAKRLASPYRPGVRSQDWIKHKNIRAQEVIVVGWQPGTGRRAGTIGSLLLALPTEHGPAYVGKVGTGFSDRMLEQLTALLEPLERPAPPLRDVPTAQASIARWVAPELVGEVAFSEWTPEGRLRHPTWRGLRPDKSPDQVRRES